MNEQRQLDIDPDSASIQTHLAMLQQVIQRMAGNSSSCKAWCVSLVAAVLVIVSDKGNSQFALISLLPIFVFASLDAYYLALEKGFRNSYNDFISKLHGKTLLESDLYSVAPKGGITSLQIEAYKSFSIWGFYVSLGLLVLIVKSFAFP